MSAKVTTAIATNTAGYHIINAAAIRAPEIISRRMDLVTIPFTAKTKDKSTGISNRINSSGVVREYGIGYTVSIATAPSGLNGEEPASLRVARSEEHTSELQSR